MLSWIKYVVVLLLVVGGGWFHLNAVESAKQSVRSEYVLKMKEQENKQLELQGAIVLEALKIEQEKNEQITRLNARTNEFLSSLSKRTSRPSEGALVTTTNTPCTGEVLYREDGEFLAREASRADRVVAERDYYYQQYEQARKQINEFNNSH